MKRWHKIVGIVFFVLLAVVETYVTILASFNFIIKGRYAGYATREMLNESVTDMQWLWRFNYVVALLLFVCLWRIWKKKP